MEIQKDESSSLRDVIREAVMQQIDLSGEIRDEAVHQLINREIFRVTGGRYMPLREKVALHSSVFNTIRRMDVLSELLDDDEISEIMINGPDHIFVERRGRLEETDTVFESPERLGQVIQQIVSGANRMVNESSPIVDSILPDGSRVNIVLRGISCDGSAVTIRKFPTEILDMKRLIGLGSLDEKTAGFLSLLVRSGYNIFISGGTGSGKTTFLNALTEYIPADERVITIEDSAELRVIGVPNLVRLEARNANLEGKNAITIRDLIKSSLRMRPDRIIVGEVRDAAAIDMLQAMNTGHDGSLSTGHANSAAEMLLRLESMVLQGADLPLMAVRQQIASALDIVVHLGRLRDKSRRVLEIREVLGMRGDEIETRLLYEFREADIQRDAAEKGHVTGRLEKVQDLKNVGKLMSAGLLQVYREQYA